eukprot:scaffold428210_cov22-Prasinocladus_malaysianus.AAC.1
MSLATRLHRGILINNRVSYCMNSGADKERPLKLVLRFLLQAEETCICCRVKYMLVAINIIRLFRAKRKALVNACQVVPVRYSRLKSFTDVPCPIAGDQKNPIVCHKIH